MGKKRIPQTEPPMCGMPISADYWAGKPIKLIKPYKHPKRPWWPNTKATPMEPTELEALRAKLPPKDRHRLRADGLLEPELAPLTLCGGLMAPYLTGRESPPSESPPTSSEPGLPRSSGAR